jgi:predicted metal-dependent hydrolase
MFLIGIKYWEVSNDYEVRGISKNLLHNSNRVIVMFQIKFQIYKFNFHS